MNTRIRLDAGESTKSLSDYITANLSDEELDAMDVHRQQREEASLVSEPITTSVTFTVAVAGAISIARLIERWMETQRQVRMMTIVVEGFKQSDQVGKALAKLASEHAKISVSYSLPKSGPDQATH